MSQSSNPVVVPNAADQPTRLANWQAIQGFLDSQGPLGPLVISLPAGTTWLDRPLQVRTPGVMIAGQGRQVSSLAAAPSSSCPALIVGLAAPASGGLAATDFTPGAINFRPGIFLAIPWQSWTVPRPSGSWSDLSAFTLEMDVILGPSATMSGALCGISNAGVPAPFLVGLGQSGQPLMFQVGTADGQTHTLSIPRSALAAGLNRLAFQGDTVAGLIGCSIDGAWQAIPSPATFTPGLKFADPSGVAMKFGATGASDKLPSEWPTSPDFAFGLTGARLSSSARYSAANPNAAPGVTHQFDAATVAYLPLTDDPAYVAAYRCVGTYGLSSGMGCGFLIDAACSSPYSEVSGASIRDLTIRGGGGGFALMTAGALDMDQRDVSCQGGAVAWGNLSVGANYTHSLSGRCSYAGNRHAIRLNYAMVRQVGILQATSTVAETLHLTECDARLDDVIMMAAIPAAARSVIYSRGGLSIRSFFADNEYVQAIPGFDAIVRCDLSQNGGNLVRLDSVTVGSVPAGASLVALDCTEKRAAFRSLYRPGRVVLGDATVQLPGSFRSLVDCRDPRWYGALDPLNVPTQAATPLLTGTLAASQTTSAPVAP